MASIGSARREEHVPFALLVAHDVRSAGIARPEHWRMISCLRPPRFVAHDVRSAGLSRSKCWRMISWHRRPRFIAHDIPLLSPSARNRSRPINHAHVIIKLCDQGDGAGLGILNCTIDPGSRINRAVKARLTSGRAGVGELALAVRSHAAAGYVLPGGRHQRGGILQAIGVGGNAIAGDEE